MKTRRSKRLSKSPLPIESDEENCVVIGKKQRISKKKSKDEILQEPEDEIVSDAAAIKKSGNTNGYGDSKLNSNGNESDSDSSTDFMQSPHTLDLNSEFFQVDFKKAGPSSDFSSIENKIFSDVQRLTDSDNSSSEEESKPTPYYEIPIPKLFQKNEPADSPDNNLKPATCNKKKRTVKDYEKSSLAKKKGSTLVKQESESIDSMNVSQLLAMGESQSNEDVKLLKSIKVSEDEMSDWEEVELDAGKEIKQEHSFPKEGVQITVDAPDIYQKRRKKGFDMEAYVKRRVNRVKREQQILVHKVHLLCWIGHGFHVNSVLNSEVLMGLSLSLIPSQHCYPNKVDITYLKKLVGWFIKSVPVVEKPVEKNTFIPLVELLQQQFESGCANSYRDLVLMFVCLLRSLGLTSRLIISLQPVRLKPSNHEMCDLKSSKKGEASDQKRNKNGKKKVLEKLKEVSEVKKKVVSVEKKKVVSEDKKKEEVSKDKKKEEVSEDKKKEEVSEDKKKEVSVTKKGPKRKYSKGARVRVLSPEDARKSNKQVMSKEEAVVLLKSAAGDAKKPKLDSTKVKDILTAGYNPRRSVRAQTKSIKYKDTTSNSEEDSEDQAIATPSKRESMSSTGHSESLPKSVTDSTMKARKSSNEKSNVKGSMKHKENKIQEKQHHESQKNNHSKGSSVLKNKDKSTDEGIRKGEVLKNNISAKERLSGKVRRRGRGLVNKKDELDEVSEENSGKEKVSNKNLHKIKNTKMEKNYSSSQTSEDEFIPPSQNTSSSLKKSMGKKKPASRKSGSESDFEHEISAKIKVSKKRNSQSSEVDRRVLSSDSEESEENETKTKNDFWTEVLIDSQEWIPINVVTGEVNGIDKLRKQATKPVTYVVAWNLDFTIKDVTRRYCKQFHSVTRKQRVDDKWWEETIFPFLSSDTARDKKEDEDMQKQMQDQPLPTSISEYKNHPLYVLKRHLLKFQAIYPPSAPTLGFVRKEAVYPRHCVYTLHSRDIWLKEAKVVRLGEKPYKIVKARPKWDRMSGKVITDLPLEIFGIWQVEDYVPPTAVDGKVPRNAYGNVELFKPTMLPKGTVHLQVPGLNRVAKKLQIDCAPAVVGFDFHCGASHPMYDGFVVCEEFQDVLLDAWNREQEEAEKREIEKREKRIYGNWRRLIKGLLIREKLKIKYAFGEEEDKASSSKGKKGKKSKMASKKPRSEDEDVDSE